MFTNIAGKLKGLAVVQTIIFVVFGIIIWTLPYQKGGFVPESDAGLFIIIGIIIILAGWIGQWLLYASATTPKSNYYRDFSKFDNSSIGWFCEYCGSKNSSDLTKCKICSRRRPEIDYKKSKR